MLIERQTITKNNLNVFKRRIAINGCSKTSNFQQKNIQKEKFKKVKNENQKDGNNQFFAKFKQSIVKTKNVKGQIEKQLNDRKKQKKFEKILENIEQRGGSFCRFGFKTHEKTHKRLFAEVLNVGPNKMKGTMHIGQIWSSSQTSKFMKQNKIYINKLKLMDKLKQAKNKQQQQLIQSTTSLYPMSQSKNSISSRLFLTQTRTQSRQSINQIPNNTFKELNKTMDQINKKLKNLKPFCSTEMNVGKLKLMEECLEKINNIDYSYHQRISQWV